MRIFTLALLLSALSIPAMAQVVPGEALVQEDTRGYARVVAFDQDDAGNIIVPHQYQITYGQPEWRDSYEAALKQLTALAKSSLRWRFGNNGWTTFTTNHDLTMGGTKVPTGLYYCCIERAADGKTSLILLDPKPILLKRMGAGMAKTTTGGIKVPLTVGKSQKVQKKLKITFTDAKDPTKSTLVISWGPRTLKAAIKLAGK